jgi:hypothetical protein
LLRRVLPFQEVDVKIVIFASTLFFSITGVASAQNNPAIQDYRTDLFGNCIGGTDIGELTKISDPIRLIGSIVYSGPIMLSGGEIGRGWAKAPIAFPVTSSESTSPETTTCTYTFETTTNGSVNVLGFAIAAGRTDVYKISVRLLMKQSLAMAAENNTQVYSWQSVRYHDQISSTISSIDDTVKDFFLFNDVAIYLLQVDRYKKVSIGSSGVLGFFTAAASYKRDETFLGTKIIVTGSPVVLARSAYSKTLIPPIAAETVQPLTNDLAKKLESDVKATATVVIP